MEPSFGTANFERRRHPRFSVDLPVEYRKVDNSKSHPAHTGNMAEGGLLLYISETIEIGQELVLKVFFTSDRKLTSASAHAQVVWKDIRIENTGPRRIGVKFIDISSEDLISLREFINNILALKSVHELNTSV
jgi:c-di-GMP-binding flagellar brake protein YcgR